MIKSLGLKVAEYAGLFRINRFLNRNKPIILMYHRIQKSSVTSGISPDIFEEQLIYIKKKFNIIPISELVNRLSKGNHIKNSISLTFDDGHSDFYENAWPLLRKHDIPAALYITTGFIDQKLWLWPDLIKHLLIKTRKKRISVRPLGLIHMGKNNISENWNLIADYCLTLNYEHRWSYLKSLADHLGVAIPESPTPGFQSVTWDQLRRMTREGLDIGSHSVTHPILKNLTRSQLEKELNFSYSRIYQELGKAPEGICYPNGMPGDITEETELIAKKKYKYGLVAYPNDSENINMMRLGRYAAANSTQGLKIIVNHFNRKS